MDENVARTDSHPHTKTDRGAVARAAGIIAVGNVLSRVMGLGRDTTIAHFLGATGKVSAFTLAWQIPLQIFNLLVGGHISAALVPVFSEYGTKERREELWRIASGFFSLVTVALAVIVLITEAVAPWVISLFGGGLSAELQQQASGLLRLMTPALIFLGLTGAVTGLLYALKRFTYPAFATALFNGGIVLTVLIANRTLGITSAALGVLLGALLQLILQLPGLRDARIRPTLRFSHPALRRIFRLYLPVILGVAVSLVGMAIDRRLASGTGESSIAWMQYATTLIQTVLGLVAAAISLAVLPSLSQADDAGDDATFQSTLGLGLRLILTLVLPATVGLLALSRPLVMVLLEHGEFTAPDTTMVTGALRLYLIGLPFAAVDQLLINAFYARKDTLRPNLVQVLAIGIYLLCALPLVGRWGMNALVLANSAQWTGHALVMLWLVWRYLGWPHDERIAATTVRALVAAGLMGLAAWGTAELAGNLVGDSGLGPRVLTVGAAIAVAVVVYLGLAVLLGLEEVGVAWRALRARLGGRRS